MFTTVFDLVYQRRQVVLWGRPFEPVEIEVSHDVEVIMVGLQLQPPVYQSGETILLAVTTTQTRDTSCIFSVYEAEEGGPFTTFANFYCEKRSICAVGWSRYNLASQPLSHKQDPSCLTMEILDSWQQCLEARDLQVLH